jgi:hypothetical protein
MDAQTISQVNQMMEHSQRDGAAHAHVLLYLLIFMVIFGALVMAWLCVSAWRSEQRASAKRRVLDRLAQEADPEGWARRQARQAQVAALVAAELADVRRARWYARLLGWGWR